jgi:hypothetical protein
MPRHIAPAVALVLALSACSARNIDSATVWTDVPEMAQYAEIFNAEHSAYRIEVSYQADLPKALASRKDKPALAIGRRLKASSLRFTFQSLDRLFTDLRLSQAAFYPELLRLGKQDGRQMFLPVSFNMPAIVFRQDKAAMLKDGFFLSLDDVKSLGKAYNLGQGTAKSRMGFSPRWNPEFLYLCATMDGASFREGKPLSWNEANLLKAITAVRQWVADANGSAAIEDDFQFKYLYNPGELSVAEGRILFSYQDSDDFFLLPEGKRSALDFRWLSQSGKVPVCEDIPYLALCRGARGARAAEAFIAWFFREDTQRRILEQAKADRSMELSFGIADGFSSLKQVNEKILPSFYPSLVGHLPTSESLDTPPILPRDWPLLKRGIVMPLLEEYCAQPPGSALPGQQEVQKRIQDWLKENPES